MRMGSPKAVPFSFVGWCGVREPAGCARSFQRRAGAPATARRCNARVSCRTQRAFARRAGSGAQKHARGVRCSAPTLVAHSQHALVDPLPRNYLGPMPPLDELTQGEREVRDLALRGLSNRSIALELFIEESTVKSHMTRVLTKSGVRSRAALIATAVETDRGGSSGSNPKPLEAIQNSAGPADWIRGRDGAARRRDAHDRALHAPRRRRRRSARRSSEAGRICASSAACRANRTQRRGISPVRSRCPQGCIIAERPPDLRGNSVVLIQRRH